ncbi:MAG: InlB B-repeat-containing protein [Ruminococcus sp.]|nr:InlB B-repeat-containing protein [Ruminococcus sp.]
MTHGGKSKDANTNSTFTFSNKFNGFTVSYYSIGSFSNNPTPTTSGSKVQYVSYTNDLYVYHERNSYILSYINPNNNEVYSTESVLYEDSLPEYSGTPTPPVGYRFAGWTYDPNGQNPVDYETATMPANNMALYAKWEKLWYLVEIDPNGGEFGLHSGGNDNSGYSTWFWVNYGDLISEYTEVTRDYEISQDGTYFYKYCDRDYYELTEEYEDREDGYTDRSAGYTEDFREATDRVHRYEPAVGAYRYAGWYRVDKQTGAETPYSFDTPVTENVLLRLHWKAVGTYYIRYNPGEGELDNSDTNEEEFQTLDTADYADKARIVIMRTVVRAPEGMNFIGWRLRNDPTGTIYYPGGAFEFDAENAETSVDEHGNERKYMVLDAVYQAIDEPSLIYDANGGTMTSNADHGSGTFLKNVSYNENTGEYTETPLTDAEKYQYNVDAGRLTVRNLENNTVVTLSNGTGFSYTYNGVTFDFYGWNTEPDGSGTRYEPGSHLYIDTTGNNPVTLYAMWKTRVYFDKNKNNSTWGGSWSEYEYDAQKDQYYKEIYLNSTIDEPPYYPAAADAIFYNWSTVKYETVEGSVPFDFSQPITQSMISSESEGTYLTLYAIWDKLPEIRVHAVDSSRKILEDKDAEWVKEEYITVGGTHIPLTAYSDVNAYADPLEENLTDYQFAFACVSNSLEKVSEEKRITDIYYNAPERHVYVTYADGTAAPLSDDEEIYLIYYNTRLPVGYVAIDTDGSISTVTVDNSAPTSVSAAGTSYNMSSDVTAPIAWANSAGNSYSFYSFAIGDVMPETPDSSALNYITTAKNSDSSRPNLYVRATWRGFEYSSNGTTWRSAGYEPELYAIYYTIEPSIVNLHEITNGLPEDMDKEFTYHVKITQLEKTVTETKFYYKDGDNYYTLPSNADFCDPSKNLIRNFTLSDSQSETNNETFTSTTVSLLNEDNESFALFYNENTGIGSYIRYNDQTYGEILYRKDRFLGLFLFDYYPIYSQTTTKVTITQSIEIVQEAEEDFTTTMSQSPANGTINLSALTYNYTATSTPRTQDITYTNTRNNTPVEVHVAVAKGGGYYEHDELRTSDESVYSKTIGSLDLQSEIQPFDLFDSADEEQYGFAGIIYGKKLDGYANNRIETEGSGITSVTYGQIDGNVYDIYLNNDTDMLLDDNEIYYVYYKKPVIVYCSEGANGTLTRIDPLTLHGAAIPQLNGQDVVQEGVLPLNGTDELVISQTIRNAFIVPPILDYAGSDVPVEYAIIGVGSPDASRLDDLQYSEDMELRLSVDEGGIVRYRFNGTDTAVPLPTADDLVVYAIYKGGNKLTISKNITRANTMVGYPTFQFSVKRIKDENGTVLDPATEEERIVSLTFTSSGTMTTELAKLPLGTYEVTELSNINYTLSDVNVSPAEETAPEGVTATVTMESRSEKTVSFVNSLNSNEKKTYQTFEGNHIVHSDQ